jgi:hypothetical protein
MNETNMFILYYIFQYKTHLKNINNMLEKYFKHPNRSFLNNIHPEIEYF